MLTGGVRREAFGSVDREEKKRREAWLPSVTPSRSSLRLSKGAVRFMAHTVAASNLADAPLATDIAKAAQTFSTPWLGRKRVAFVPLFRSHAAPPDLIPSDWENVILRRVLYDPRP